MRRNPRYTRGLLCLPPRVRMDTASNLWTTLNTRLLCVHRNMWQSCDVHVSHALSPFGPTLQLSTALQVSIFCLLEATWYQDLSILPAIYAYQILEATKVYEIWLTPVTTEVLLQTISRKYVQGCRYFSVSHVKPCVLACTFLVLLAKYQGRGVWLACFYF